MKAKKIRFKFLEEYRNHLYELKQKLNNNDEAYSVLNDEYEKVNDEYEKLMWSIKSKTDKQYYRIANIGGLRRFTNKVVLNWAIVELYDEIRILIPYIKAMGNYQDSRKGILKFCKNTMKVIDNNDSIYYNKKKFYTEQQTDDIFNEFFRVLEPESIKTHPEAEQKVIDFYNNYKKFLVVLNQECED